MSTFSPRTAVITGGASGIGLEIGRELSARGITIMLADLPGERLERVAKLLDGALVQPCDVRDLEQVEALAEAAFEQLGEVHLVLNNAGVGGPRGKLWEVDPEATRAHFDCTAPDRAAGSQCNLQHR